MPCVTVGFTEYAAPKRRKGVVCTLYLNRLVLPRMEMSHLRFKRCLLLRRLGCECRYLRLHVCNLLMYGSGVLFLGNACATTNC